MYYKKEEPNALLADICNMLLITSGATKSRIATDGHTGDKSVDACLRGETN